MRFSILWVHLNYAHVKYHWKLASLYHTCWFWCYFQWLRIKYHFSLPTSSTHTCFIFSFRYYAYGLRSLLRWRFSLAARDILQNGLILNRNSLSICRSERHELFLTYHFIRQYAISISPFLPLILFGSNILRMIIIWCGLSHSSTNTFQWAGIILIFEVGFDSFT